MNNNLNLLQDTLAILNAGKYSVDGKEVILPHKKEEQKQVQVFLPEDIEEIRQAKRTPVHSLGARCGIRCENKDSFAAARDLLPYSNLWSNQRQSRGKYWCSTLPIRSNRAEASGAVQERRRKTFAENLHCCFLWKVTPQCGIMITTAGCIAG